MIFISYQLSVISNCTLYKKFCNYSGLEQGIALHKDIVCVVGAILYGCPLTKESD